VSCESNNATPPGPAIAPGAEAIDPRAAAEAFLRRCPGGIDPRIAAAVPGFDAPYFQAGLAGYSDAAMRIVARRHGCPFCVTEALLDRTLLAGGRGFAKADLGDIDGNVPGGEEDHPLAGQIMGSDPREMAAAAIKMVEQGRRTEREYRKLAYIDGATPPTTHLRLPGGEQLGRQGDEPQWFRDASGNPGPNPSTPRHLDTSTPLSSRTFATIDVNLACPVKKIDKKARGGHWLSEPQGAVMLLEAVRRAVPPEIPCTVKLRRSYDETPEMAAAAERILAAAFDAGYLWATVHARTVEQKYIGPSRWDLLRRIVERHPGRLIFGSGDVWDAADIFRMIAYTGVCGVSVARGCIGNPWIFRQARDLMAGRPPRPPTIAEQRAVLEEHFRLALSVNHGMRKAEAHTGRTMRKFGIRFAAHHPRAEDVRRRFIAVTSLDDWRAVLDEFYGAPQASPAHARDAAGVP
jgi:tRNA-dihydrouridine synthase